MSKTASSLRRQLLQWLLIPLLALFAGSSAVSYYVAISFADLAHDYELYDIALSMWQQVRVVEGRAVIELPQAALQILEFDSRDKIYVRLSAADGRFISGSHELPDPPAPGRGAVSYYDATIRGEPVRVALLRERLPESNIEVAVQAAETRVKRDLFAKDILLAVVIPQLLIIAVAGALVGLGVRRGLRPLQQITDAVGGRSYVDLSAIPERDVPEEVRPLTRAINGLLAHLGDAFDSQRRFIADAAHQLRTPLAGLAAWIDRAVRAPDIETVKPALKQLEISSHRATRLVNQLLALARAEPSAKPQHDFAIIDLSLLARRVCRDWVPQALAQDVDLGYSGPDSGVVVLGHDLLLDEMLSNLVDNAINYGGAGGRITVRLTPGLAPVLRVEDDGPGIPEAERERVLERFYRIAGTPGGGCGLGLAIGQEIARAHGAALEITQPETGKGTVVIIRFPAIAGST
jgi:two-component system sensor histidine kinase TctE